MAYLRFTPGEFRALCRACRVMGFDDDAEVFQASLVLWLAQDWPGLARRVAGLPPPELALLRDHLRGRLRDRLRGEPGPHFTPAERQALAEACGSLLGTARFASPFRDVLVRHFRKVSPLLGRKLAGLSGREFERLWQEVRGGRSGP